MREVRNNAALYGLETLGARGLVDTYPCATTVVVGFNSARWLPVCLTSLTQQDYPAPHEVIFVDNESIDDSVEIVRTRFPSVRIIESRNNLGYAGGNNLGANYAHGEVLAFVNPDTKAQPNWLRELVRPLVVDPGVGLTTSKIVLMDKPEIINACGNDISLSGITTCHRAGEHAVAVTDDEDVTAVSGAACAIRKDLFRNLGGFDERFWMYLEDTDLSWRARLAGYRCVLAAQSVIAHDYVFKLTAAKTRRIERNRYLMLSKNLGVRSLLALIPGFLATELLTWGWAAMNGWRQIGSKVWATLWMLGNVSQVLHSRRASQPLRKISDSHLLSHFQRAPAIAEVGTGLAGQIASTMFTPILVATAMVGIALIGVSNGELPVEPHTLVADAAREAGPGD